MENEGRKAQEEEKEEEKEDEEEKEEEEEEQEKEKEENEEEKEADEAEKEEEEEKEKQKEEEEDEEEEEKEEDEEEKEKEEEEDEEAEEKEDGGGLVQAWQKWGPSDSLSLKPLNKSTPTHWSLGSCLAVGRRIAGADLKANTSKPLNDNGTIPIKKTLFFQEAAPHENCMIRVRVWKSETRFWTTLTWTWLWDAPRLLTI